MSRCSIGDLKPNNVVEDLFLDFDELLAFTPNRVVSNLFTSTPNNRQAFEKVGLQGEAETFHEIATYKSCP